MRARCKRGSTLLEAVVTVAVTGLLFAILLPLFTKTVCDRGMTRHLNNAKGIYLGLKMYAGDHNGEFPSKTADGKPLSNANEAFRYLVPNYIPTKSVFYSKSSPWTPTPPDDHIIPGKTPMAGENHFAYVPNLIDTDNPSFPLIATGFTKGTPGVYNPDQHEAKSTSGTFEVVVVRVDGSGMISKEATKDFRIYDKLNSHEKRDIFKPAPGWLRPDQAPLNPEG